MEKCLLHALQRYRIEELRLVFLITLKVERQVGHLNFFSYTPSNHTLVYLDQVKVPFLGDSFDTVPSCIFFADLLFSNIAMEIKYLGHASFLIKTKEAKLVTDPYDSSIGIHFPKTEADIVTVSHQHADHNNLKGIAGEPLIIDWPGEFEKKGIRVFGYQWYHDEKKGEQRGMNTLYKIEADDINVLHCGDIGVLPNDALYEEIGNIDVLLVPTGGFYTIDEQQAAQMVKKIDPSIVIPMHYNHDKLDQSTFGKLSKLDAFLKQMGVDTPAPVDKLALKKEDLGDEIKVVVMSF